MPTKRTKMQANGSQILLHEFCPKLWYLTYYEKRGRPASRAMAFGTRWHQTCELDKYTRGDGTPLEELRLKYGLQLWRNARTEWDIEEIAKEVSLDTRFKGFDLFGQLDSIVKWNGFYWHLQHKTLAETTPLQPYTRSLSASWHEHLYAFLVERSKPEFSPWGGSIFVILRKLPAKRRGDTKRGKMIVGLKTRAQWLKDMLYVEPVRIEKDPTFEAALLNQLAIMEQDTEFPVSIAKNRSNCFHFNQLCPAFAHCHENESMDDIPRVNPLERYGATEELL